MKNLAITQFSILAFVSGVATGLTFLSEGVVAHHWYELFYEGETTLPELTIFATQYGYLIPLVCCIASIIGIVVSIKKGGDTALLWRLFTLIVSVELIGLALIALFNMVPAFKIMYRLM